MKELPLEKQINLIKQEIYAGKFSKLYKLTHHHKQLLELIFSQSDDINKIYKLIDEILTTLINNLNKNNCSMNSYYFGQFVMYGLPIRKYSEDIFDIVCECSILDDWPEGQVDPTIIRNQLREYMKQMNSK
jgi:hypothetical protein